MKKFLSLVLFFCVSTGYCQTFQAVKVDSISGLVVFSEVVSVKDASKDSLFLKSREWFSTYFTSGQDVVDLEDKANSKVIGNGMCYIKIKTIGIVQVKMFYTITIQSKDNRYKYTLSNIRYKLPPSEYFPNPEFQYAEASITDEEVILVKPKVRNQYRVETLKAINEIAENLKLFMESKHTNNSEW